MYEDDDNFYDDEDPKRMTAEVNAMEPHEGCILSFAPESFFAKRGGQLRASVLSVNYPDGDDRGTINVKCLEGTNCYLSPGETESFPFIGWEKTLRIIEPASCKSKE